MATKKGSIGHEVHGRGAGGSRLTPSWHIAPCPTGALPDKHWDDVRGERSEAHPPPPPAAGGRRGGSPGCVGGRGEEGEGGGAPFGPPASFAKPPHPPE